MNKSAYTVVTISATFLLVFFTDSSALPKDACSFGSAQYEGIRAVGEYKDYAFSSDPLSFTKVEPGEGKYKPKALAICNGFVKLYSESAQTVLYMPFGWEATETGKDTRFWAPDERTRIILHFANDPGLIQTNINSSQFTSANIQATIDEARRTAAKIGAKQFQQILIDNSNIAFKILDVPTQSGAKNSLMQIITFNEVKPDFPMSISLTAPSDQFDKYSRLMGLILRDREIKWTTGDESFEQFLDMRKEAGSPFLQEDSLDTQNSSTFYQFAKEAIQELAKGNEERFMKLISSTGVGAGKWKQYVREALIPFFSGYEGEGDSRTIAPTADASGNKGYSFYMSAKTRRLSENSSQKSIL
jgi:hypothetical protein